MAGGRVMGIHCLKGTKFSFYKIKIVNFMLYVTLPQFKKWKNENIAQTEKFPDEITI